VTYTIWTAGSGAHETQLRHLFRKRAKLWQVLCSENAKNLNSNGSDRTIFMPESLLNSAKTKVYSAAPAGGIPDRIKPLSGSGEWAVIFALLTELIETFAMDLEPEPLLNRCAGSQGTEKNAHTAELSSLAQVMFSD
jgi:hypothetical protein